MTLTPSVIAALLVATIYAGMGLSVWFPRVAFGLQSDESTYYMMTYSLARDGDLVYRREDLTRVWQDFPSGPFGVFLKRGSELDLQVSGNWPFVRLTATPDQDPTRLYYGKSPVYPVFAAPFVALAGTNGFILFHALLLGLMTWAACVFLSLRASPTVALLLGTSFVLATVVPAYTVWTTPELFNLACVLLGYFCWLYKETAAARAHPDTPRWLIGAKSDLLAAALIGLATASKPTNLFLIGPPLVWYLWKRQWGRFITAGMVFTLVVAAFFGATMAISGEWNFQGGDRRTFYGPYPFQTADQTFETLGSDRATDRLLTEIVFDPTVFLTVFLHNLWWFFIGRHSGLIAYFFPAVFALVAFALARGRRASWQYLVLGVAVLEIVLLLITIPYNYFGGGGTLGNRYFMPTYGLFLFLIPPIASTGVALMPWLVGAFFTSQITLNPFFAAFNPDEHAKQGPLRLLPVELGLINELPVNTDPPRSRVWFGERPRFQVYFLDNNAYNREQNAFWVRGSSTAEILIKSDVSADRLFLRLGNGAFENEVTVRTGAERQTFRLQPREVKEVTVPLGNGYPYQGRWVWAVSIASARGFTPMFEEGGTDNRYLGVFVKPELRP